MSKLKLERNLISVLFVDESLAIVEVVYAMKEHSKQNNENLLANSILGEDYRFQTYFD